MNPSFSVQPILATNRALLGALVCFCVLAAAHTACSQGTQPLPTAAEIAAYNAARTPQISVTLGTGSSPVAVPIIDGACTRVALPLSQTTVAVVLTYPAGNAGQVVWVQPTRGGTLSTVGADGKTYDGSQGFFLTLDALNTVTFTYQAPRSTGTYQVLTRFSNVLTVVPFTVSAVAP